MQKIYVVLIGGMHAVDKKTILNPIEKNYKFILNVLLLAFAIIISPSSAANVTSPDKVVAQGDLFELNISIDPLGTAISGAQLNFAFNNSLFKVNSITEGNLFNQNGATTFFSKGVINNTNGNVINIFDVIIGYKNVSSPGIFIIVNMTATGSGGYSTIDLSNIKISDPDALPVIVDSTNGSIQINSLLMRNPSVDNPTASHEIPDDTDNEPMWGETAQLNVTVTHLIWVASVTVNLSEVGGQMAKTMINIGDNVWTTTTNASPGTPPKIYNLTVNATDLFGNYNNNIKIPLRVMKNGDLTGNGIVNIGDSLLCANNVNFPDFINPYIADVTGNGVINIGDCLRLANNVSYSGYPTFILK